MSKVTVLCLVAMISLATTANGQDKKKADDSAEVNGRNASAVTVPFGGAANLFQSAADLRAASESLARFGESLEKTTTNIGDATDSVAGHMAQMSSGFDPLGLQNAFKTIQQQSEVIRQQQEIINDLHQKEIQRLKRENQQLKAANKAESSQPASKKKKRNKPSTFGST